MNKYTMVIAILFAIVGTTNAQVETFENVTLDSGKVLNGFNGEKEFNFSFSGGNLIMPTFWDTSFGGFWSSGWAISRKYDSATMSTDFARHLYCVKAYKGYNNSNTFAIGQNGSYLYRSRISKEGISKLKITNTTAAYNSMKLGDAFAKKFGGRTGNDSDYLYCKMMQYNKGVFVDSQIVYLADFRSSNNANDYILNSWKVVDFVQETDSIIFKLYSSDTSEWGINTPAFFAIDDIEYNYIENISNVNTLSMKAHPNPAQESITFRSTNPINKLVVFSPNGTIVKTLNSEQNTEVKMDVSDCANGMYIVRFSTENGTGILRVMVQH
ncbi:MAG: DUF4465 domain-containing protein [Bacteroidia bacterium]|nr:DUF4465 domain-containing protein [Bacteroidia bacterium]